MNAIARRIKKAAPRVVMFLMALVVTSGVIVAPAAFAAEEKTPTGGNATSRTAAIINLAKNQKLSDTNASSLKPEELRILGTFELLRALPEPVQLQWLDHAEGQ